jgi:hypothetical protein
VALELRIYSKLEKVKFQIGMESSQNWFFTITLNNKKTSALISDSPAIDSDDIIYLPREIV